MASFFLKSTISRVSRAKSRLHWLNVLSQAEKRKKRNEDIITLLICAHVTTMPWVWVAWRMCWVKEQRIEGNFECSNMSQLSENYPYISVCWPGCAEEKCPSFPSGTNVNKHHMACEAGTCPLPVLRKQLQPMLLLCVWHCHQRHNRHPESKIYPALLWRGIQRVGRCFLVSVGEGDCLMMPIHFLPPLATEQMCGEESISSFQWISRKLTHVSVDIPSFHSSSNLSIAIISVCFGHQPLPFLPSFSV